MLLGCERSAETTSSSYFPKIKKSRKISTDGFIPNSYQFNSVPRYYKKNYHYLDRSNSSLIILSESFDFFKSIPLRGEGPNLMNVLHETSTATNLFFAFGNQSCIVVDLESNEKYGPFRHEFILPQSVAKFRDGFLLGNVSETKGFRLSYFEFDKDAGLINIEKKVSIPFDEGVSPVDMSGHVEVFDNSIVFVKDWSGEAYSYDYDFKLKKQKQLDFSGNLELNINRDEGELLYEFYQAYSTTKTPNNLLAVMREVDFQENDNLDLNDVDEELVRKRIHFFDEELNYKGGLKLDFFSTDIHFQANKLHTLNYKSEAIIEYELEN
jgi:hypothetical protein